MKTRLLVALVFLAVCPRSFASASDEKADADSLEKLSAELRKVVPEGWGVDLALADSQRHDRNGSIPTLIIQTEKPLPLEFDFPGGAGPGQALLRTTEPVVIRLRAVAFVAPDQYELRKQQNHELQSQRSEFVKNRLRDIPSAYKGNEPIPPEAFRPRTAADKRLLREYAFLWLRTQPTSLPTHHYQKLSLVLEQPFYMTIRDEQKAKEYENIRKAIGKIANLYDEPEQRD